jgi:uncharacterized protein
VKRIGYISAGVVLGAIVALTLPSLAQDTGSPAPTNTNRTVTVSGTATIKAKPDEAVVSLGVQTQANTAQTALADNAVKMTALIASLTDKGIAKDDIATSYVSIYPMYGNNGMDITGYQVVNQVDVTLRDISKVGAVIDDAVKAGANLSNGITFKLSDENQGVNQALADAVANARSKAESLAGAGDAQLGQVVTIQEGSPAYAPPIYYGRDMAASAGAASTPIQPPTLETQVSVTVTWTLT